MIVAEREGERRQPRIVRCVGEAIAAGRQQGDELPRPEQVFHRRIGGFDAEQYAGQRAVGFWHDEMAAGLGLIAGGADVDLLAVVDLLNGGVECGGVDEQDRDRRPVFGFNEQWMHVYSAASRKEGGMGGFGL